MKTSNIMKYKKGIALALVVAAALPLAAHADGFDVGTLSKSWKDQAIAVRDFAVILFGLIGIFMVGFGLYQATVGRKNDPQIKLGASLGIALAGGLIAAVVGTTGVFQDTFGTKPGTGTSSVISNE